MSSKKNPKLCFGTVPHVYTLLLKTGPNSDSVAKHKPAFLNMSKTLMVCGLTCLKGAALDALWLLWVSFRSLGVKNEVGSKRLMARWDA